MLSIISKLQFNR